MRALVCAIVAAVGLTASAAFAQADRPAAAIWKSVQAVCNAAAAKPASETGQTIARAAIEEFTRFGGHRIDADGKLFRFGLTEAEHEAEFDDGRQARQDRLGWWQVMKYWYALFGDETADKLEVRGYRDASTSKDDSQGAALIRTTAARLLRLAEETGDPDERELLREAALRAAIVDTSWSAAFVSYVVRQSGAGARGFRFANAHSVYIYDAFATSLAEAAKEAGEGLYRACPVAGTRPRPGDMLCVQREPALADASEQTVRERIRADLAAGTMPRSIRRTHCEVVAHVDAAARKLYTIGGNVNQAVAARKLNLRRNLTFPVAQRSRCGGKGHWTLPGIVAPSAPSRASLCSLNDRKWFVLLQVR
jgi:hypothetical protein